MVAASYGAESVTRRLATLRKHLAIQGHEKYPRSMSTFKAIVSGGQAIIEDVGDYPDGTVLEIAIVDNDQMSAEERARVDAELEASLDDLEAGRTKPAAEVFARLFAQC